MFLPPVSAASYLPPARSGELRSVAAAAPVRGGQRRESQPKLDADELKLLEQMRTRDRDLRQHERAQVLFGSTWVRTLPSYTYERGPDGDFYAIDGVAALDLGGRGMLDPALGPSTSNAEPEIKPSAAPIADPRALTLAAPVRRDEGFAGAAARFYLASANAAPRRPVVDLFA
jgi:hypothetical protein